MKNRIFCFSMFFMLFFQSVFSQNIPESESFNPNSPHANIAFGINTTVEQDEYMAVESHDTIQANFLFDEWTLVFTDPYKSGNNALWTENIVGFENTIPNVQLSVWTNMSRYEIVYGPYPSVIMIIEFPYIGQVESRKYYWIKNKRPNPNGQGGTNFHEPCTLCLWNR